MFRQYEPKGGTNILTIYFNN